MLTTSCAELNIIYSTSDLLVVPFFCPQLILEKPRHPGQIFPNELLPWWFWSFNMISIGCSSSGPAGEGGCFVGWAAEAEEN